MKGRNLYIMKKFAILFLALLTVLIPTLVSLTTVSAASFNDPNFQVIWQRVDQLVATDPNAGRSWTWGPNNFANSPTSEPYNGGTRTVQYFDKARMEVNNPNGDRSSLFFVTSGLLVKELVTGLRQDADNIFTPFTAGSANIPVAGDPNDSSNNFGNPSGPTYASFKNVTTFNNDHRADAAADGTVINASLNISGTLGTVTPTANVKVVANAYDNVTGHNMVDVFVAFQNQSGRVYNPNTQEYVQGSVYFNNPLFVFGHPVSEPYWVTTNVAGKPTAVLVQLFERRVLTYTPSNPAAFQVEMGNIGQHYYKWRYVVNNPGTTPTTPPATTTPVPAVSTDYTQFRAAYNKSGTIPNGTTTALTYTVNSDTINTSVALDTAQNLAVFGTDNNGVVAVNTSSGLTKWSFKGVVKFDGTPAIVNGIVYIGSSDGKVYALNEADGTQKWATPASGSTVTGVPATDGTNIYFASRDGKVYAYDLATGQVAKWQFTTNPQAEIDNGPVLSSDGTLYFGTNGSTATNVFYAVKAGSQTWKFTAPSGEGFLAQAALSSDGSVIYVGSTKGTMYALNTVDGSTKWSSAVSTGAPGFALGGTPAITSLGLFVGSDNGTVSLLDPNNGTVSTSWKITLPSAAAIRSSLAVVDNVVYFGANNGKVYGFDARNSANETFQASVSGSGTPINYNSPVVNNGQLYITSTDGHFYIFK
jgi:outer membrane protein assembly factor BamB